jgi:hypothetical protein
MSETMKIVLALVGVFIAGIVTISMSKNQGEGKADAASMIRSYSALQEMANSKCPSAIKDATGEQVYFPSETASDKSSYITLKWQGENSKKGGFKVASCTLLATLGGISELIIDGKTIIKK